MVAARPNHLVVVDEDAGVFELVGEGTLLTKSTPLSYYSVIQYCGLQDKGNSPDEVKQKAGRAAHLEGPACVGFHINLREDGPQYLTVALLYNAHRLLLQGPGAESQDTTNLADDWNAFAQNHIPSTFSEGGNTTRIVWTCGPEAEPEGLWSGSGPPSSTTASVQAGMGWNGWYAYRKVQRENETPNLAGGINETRSERLEQEADGNLSDNENPDEKIDASTMVDNANNGEKHLLEVLGTSEKFFQVNAERVASIVGRDWCLQGEKATFRARNRRTAKEGGLLLWKKRMGKVGSAYGCWNPLEFSSEADFAVGDVLEFLDYHPMVVGGPSPKRDEKDGAVIPIQSFAARTGTGWNLPAELVQFGEEGIVGDWWKELEIELHFDGSHRINTVYADSGSRLPFTVSFRRADDTLWEEMADGEMPDFCTTACRMRWASTDLHRLPQGLSTYRNRGGVHVVIRGHPSSVSSTLSTEDLSCNANSEDDASSAYSFRVLGVHDDKYFQANAACIHRILGGVDWCVHSSNACLRARNRRTGHEAGLLIWKKGIGQCGSAHGCWNPVEFSPRGAFQEGDVIELIDYHPSVVGGPSPQLTESSSGVVIPITSYKLLTSTGWNLSGELLQFGEAGLVGPWWNELGVELEWNGSYVIRSVHTDSGDELEYTVSFRRDDDGTWEEMKNGATPDFATVGCRIRWESTNMHNLPKGLSTYRNGGGIHVVLRGHLSPVAMQKQVLSSPTPSLGVSSFRVMGVYKFKYCQVDAARVTKILGGTWSKHSTFASLRARNQRTGKEGRITMLNKPIGDRGSAHGCWTDHSQEGAFREGDVIDLIDYHPTVMGGPSPRLQDTTCGVVVPIKSCKVLTLAGLTLPADLIRFGEEGLAGGWWKENGLELQLDGSYVVRSVYTDLGDEPEPVLSFLRGDGTWEEMQHGIMPGFATTACRIRWKSSGASDNLSTAGESMHIAVRGHLTSSSYSSSFQNVDGNEGEEKKSFFGSEESARGEEGTVAVTDENDSAPPALDVYTFRVLGVQKNRYCQIDAACVTKIIGGDWAAHNGATSLRAKNRRTGRQGVLLIWKRPIGERGSAHGCWSRLSVEKDTAPFQLGDMIDLLDYRLTVLDGPSPHVKESPYGVIVPIKSYRLVSSTTVSAAMLRFGEAGLVGACWTPAELQWDGSYLVKSVYSDSEEGLVEKLSFRRADDGTWQDMMEGAMPTFASTACRIRWERANDCGAGKAGNGVHVVLRGVKQEGAVGSNAGKDAVTPSWAPASLTPSAVSPPISAALLSRSTPLLEAILSCDLQSRRHRIQGTWNYENSSLPPQRFELIRNLRSDEDPTVLPQNGTFHGSFCLAYYHTTSTGKQKVRSKVIAETNVQIEFRQSEGAPQAFSMTGHGSNQFGVFDLEGTASKSPREGDPTYDLKFRKSYRRM